MASKQDLLIKTRMKLNAIGFSIAEVRTIDPDLQKLNTTALFALYRELNIYQHGRIEALRIVDSYHPKAGLFV